LSPAVWQPAAATATALGQSGFPLGIEPLTRFLHANRHAFAAGRAALLYTDGLSETRNAAGEMLGEKNLLRMLAHAAAETTGASAGKDFLLGRLADFRGHTPLTDDQTLILIRHQK
jgi:serine phosphatase RsbU (regulator of sigma subunit)